MQRDTLAIGPTRQIATARGKASLTEERLQAPATRDQAFDLDDLGKAGSSTASVRKPGQARVPIPGPGSKHGIFVLGGEHPHGHGHVAL